MPGLQSFLSFFVFLPRTTILVVNLLWLYFCYGQTFAQMLWYGIHYMSHCYMSAKRPRWTGLYFLQHQPKTCFDPIFAQLNSVKKRFEGSESCKPKTTVKMAFGGLHYLLSVCVDIIVKIGVWSFSNQQ
jgi:hypothetical protein